MYLLGLKHTTLFSEEQPNQPQAWHGSKYHGHSIDTEDAKKAQESKKSKD